MKTYLLDSSRIISCEHVSLASFNNIVKFLKFISLRFYREVVVLTDKDSVILSRWGVKNRVIKNPIVFRGYERTLTYKRALAIGRLSPQKGFDRLLYIWSEFVKNNKNWVLQIAGDGPELNNLKMIISKLNLEGSVALLGKVKEINELYKNSDIYLMTSRYEGLPLVLLEAKSWSLPVISYDCPTGPAEIINDGVDGYLIEDENSSEFIEKMTHLISTPGLLVQMSNNCKTSSLEFSSEKISQQWLKTLEDN
nr:MULTISPECIES: glycosyltransferase [unclassified Tatumella]